MIMKILLNKGIGKPNTLVCTRDDGSTSITRLNIPAEHDLCHYVVETTLGFRDAFYGLVAGVMEIQDFNAPGTAMTLPREALYAEFIVGLFRSS